MTHVHREGSECISHLPELFHFFLFCGFYQSFYLFEAMCERCPRAEIFTICTTCRSMYDARSQGVHFLPVLDILYLFCGFHDSFYLFRPRASTLPTSRKFHELHNLMSFTKMLSVCLVSAERFIDPNVSGVVLINAMDWVANPISLSRPDGVV